MSRGPVRPAQHFQRAFLEFGTLIFRRLNKFQQHFAGRCGVNHNVAGRFESSCREPFALNPDFRKHRAKHLCVSRLWRRVNSVIIPPMKTHKRFLLLWLIMPILIFAPEISGAPRPNILWFVVDDMSANFSCYGEKLDRRRRTSIGWREKGRSSATRSSRRRFARPAARRSSPACIRPPSARITTAAAAAWKRFTCPTASSPCRCCSRRPATTPASAAAWPMRTARARRQRKRRQARQDGLQLRVGPEDVRRRRLGGPQAGPAVLHAGAAGRRQAARRERCECAAAVRARAKASSARRPSRTTSTLPPYYPRDPVLLRDWAAYLDAVRFTDKHVGEVLARLEKEGILDQTLIIFMTDHGISHARGKQFLYDEGTHVPFVVRGPGIAKGVVRDDLVEHIDLAADLARRRGHSDSDDDAGQECVREGLRAARRRVRRPRPLRRDGRTHPQRAHRPVPLHPQLPSAAAAPAAQRLQGRQDHRANAARAARRREARPAVRETALQPHAPGRGTV